MKQSDMITLRLSLYRHRFTKHTKKYIVEIEPAECKEAIVSLFNYYCKERFYSDKKLEYFKDYTLEEVLKQSKVQKSWNEKFAKIEKVKMDFLALKIVKDFSTND